MSIQDQDTPSRPPEVHAEAVFLRWTTFGFRLEVGLPGDTSRLAMTDIVITMSPQMALSLTSLLQTHVAQYEEKFGPINLIPCTPPDA